MLGVGTHTKNLIDHLPHLGLVAAGKLTRVRESEQISDTELLNANQAPRFIGSVILVELLLPGFHFISHKMEIIITPTSWEYSGA